MGSRRAGAPPASRGRVAEPGPAELDVTVDEHGTSTLIRLRGGLGSSTATVVREAVERVLATGPIAVVLDLTDVVADDELGLWVVPAVAGDAHGRGVGFTVVATDRKLRMRLRRLGARPFEITDVLCPPDP